MKRRALVITRTPVFGDQVTKALELEGRFCAQAFESINAALEDGRREPFDLAVLDADAADQPLEQAARALRRICPASALILVPPGNWVSSALVNRIAPDGMLTKPLNPTDLADILDEIHQRFYAEDGPSHSERPALPVQPVQSQSSEGSYNEANPFMSSEQSPKQRTSGRGLVIERIGADKDPARSNHGWLYDVSRAAQYLARLSMETSAQAAVIVRGGKIWAYAGQMSQADAQEFATVVVEHWNRSERPNARSYLGKGHSVSQQPDRCDLIRFVRLFEQDFILYATGLVDNLVLALAFDAGVPFRMIRAQAVHLAQALAQPPELNHELPSGKIDPIEEPSAAIPVQISASRASESHEGMIDGSTPPDAAQRSVQATSLLENVPPPNPGRETNGPRNVETRSESVALESKQAAAPKPSSPSHEESPDEIHPPWSNPRKIDIPAGLPISPAILHTGRPDLDTPDDSAGLPPSLQGHPENMGDRATIGLEPVTPALSGLLYTCVMVPRIPTHTLTGDLAARLVEWMPLLCLAYGWRLERLEHHRDYLAWVVRVQLDTSPSYMMRILRQKTSLRVFADFPTLARENPSGDFWAPGYLILSSGALPSTDTIRSFIQQTRFYQGGTGPIILNVSR